jgi:hypothetical protein
MSAACTPLTAASLHGAFTRRCPTGSHNPAAGGSRLIDTALFASGS